MITHFAFAPKAANRSLHRALAVPCWREADNDNGSAPKAEVLRAALKFFAQPGLSAAERAKELAQEAFFNDDRKAYKHWLEICRALDRRMAAAVEARR